ncbi:hypothetical protein PCK1_002224 [Pneumocystis canis]|nr:hypothetical protein PCK1_002224 [Pneumocystis canis]
MKKEYISALLWMTAVIQAAHLLVHNPLDPNKPVLSTLLLNPGRPCSHYHEKLLKYTEMSQKDREIIYQQVKCHHKQHSLSYEYYYIYQDSSSSSDSSRCAAIKIKDGTVAAVPCKDNYPSLCTNSGPKRTHTSGISNATNLLHSIYSYYGHMIGTRSDVVFSFLGIPYAFPPVNELRFKHPVCISKLRGTWDASYFRSYCPQDDHTVSNPVLNENCLFLNVFTPYIPDANDKLSMRLPVMIWIHGGSFLRGDVSQPYHDPSHLASHEKVVVVTFNYRLGVLGFWGSGNQAIRDQIIVLEWVRDFIEDFGGDPNKVTLCGESAGAKAVRTLLFAKKKTQGLFHAAILASDPLYLGFATKADNENILSRHMAKAVNCIKDTETIHDPEVMDCMRKVPVSTLITYQEHVGLIAPITATSLTRAESYKPTIDDDLFTKDFYDLLLEGNFVKVPIMIGFLEHEDQNEPSRCFSRRSDSSSMTSTREIEIKMKIIQRLIRDLSMCKEELEIEENRYSQYEIKGEDEYVLRKQKQVIEDCRKMIPDTKFRLEQALETLYQDQIHGKINESDLSKVETLMQEAKLLL